MNKELSTRKLLRSTDIIWFIFRLSHYKHNCTLHGSATALHEEFWGNQTQDDYTKQKMDIWNCTDYFILNRLAFLKVI